MIPGVEKAKKGLFYFYFMALAMNMNILNVDLRQHPKTTEYFTEQKIFRTAPMVERQNILRKLIYADQFE